MGSIRSKMALVMVQCTDPKEARASIGWRLGLLLAACRLAATSCCVYGGVRLLTLLFIECTI